VSPPRLRSTQRARSRTRSVTPRTCHPGPAPARPPWPPHWGRAATPSLCPRATPAAPPLPGCSSMDGAWPPACPRSLAGRAAGGLGLPEEGLGSPSRHLSWRLTLEKSPQAPAPSQFHHKYPGRASGAELIVQARPQPRRKPAASGWGPQAGTGNPGAPQGPGPPTSLAPF
jgi:hypothetical protein